MVATIVVKSVIWVWCARFQSSGIQALAQVSTSKTVFDF
jgi:hypothetical protein